MGVMDHVFLLMKAKATGWHHLLDVGRQLGQRLRVRQDRAAGVAQEGDVPHAQQPHQHGEVLLERRRAEVLIDIVRACDGEGNQIGDSWETNT
jgi:hypothetical protein